MRRYLFYLAIALSAFVIGAFVAAKFWNQSLMTVKNETPPEIKTVAQVNPDNPSKSKFSCEDEAVKTVWAKLEKDKTEIEDIYRVLQAHHINNCRELFERQTVDLNNDESDEIILKGGFILFCGSSGDCRTWIVSKIKNEYRIILDAYAGESAENIEPLPEKTYNFKNIRVKTNNGWSADNIGIFKFDGKQYLIKKCYKDVNSEYDYDDIRDEKLVSVKFDECL